MSVGGPCTVISSTDAHAARASALLVCVQVVDCSLDLDTTARCGPCADLNDERELSVVTRLACGAVAGTTGQTVAYPLDVVRRRMQVRGAPILHTLKTALLSMHVTGMPRDAGAGTFLG